MNSSFLDEGVVNWNIHNGEKYMLIDFTGLDGAQVQSLTMAISEKLIEAGEGNARLVTDLSGLGRDVNSFSSGRNFAKAHQKYLHKSAVIGVPAWLNPIYNIFMKFTGSNAQLFKTKEQALDYICS